MEGKEGGETKRKEGVSQGIRCEGNSLPIAQRVENISIASVMQQIFDSRSIQKWHWEGTLGEDLCFKRLVFSWKHKLRFQTREASFTAANRCSKNTI